MARRVLTAGIGVPLGIAVVFLDFDPLYLVLLSVFSVISVYELLIATKYLQNKLISAVGLCFAVAVPSVFYFPQLRENVILIACVFVFLLFMIMLFTHSKLRFEQLTLVFFISTVIPLAFASVLFIKTVFGEHGTFYVVFTMLAAWIGDAGAYFVGVKFGKHKLAPQISPKKTWEGMFGGLLSAGLSGFLCGIGYEWINQWLYGASALDVNEWYLAATAVLVAVFGLMGDLSASVIKRQCAIKDFGNVFPGHGGILDRFDSVLFAAPFVYQLFQVHPPI
jgi:phosphatidate cytidylyltransferase